MPLTRQALFDHLASEHRHTYFYRPSKETLEDDHGRAHSSTPLPAHGHDEGQLTKAAVVTMLAAGRELLNRAERAMGPRRADRVGLGRVLDELDAAIVAFEPSPDRYDRASRDL